MAKYTSKPVSVPLGATEVSDKFADLSRLEGALDHLSADDRAKVGDVTFETDSIAINTPQVGQIKFRVTERTPERVVFAAESSPVPLSMIVELKPESATATSLEAAIDVEIPAMLRPMLGGTMQKAADQFGELLGRLCSR